MAKSKQKTLLALGALSLFALFNVVAYRQARAMTHFARRGRKTAAPERLTFLAKLRVLLTGITLPRPENLTTPESHDLPFDTIHLPATGADPALELWHIQRTDSAGMIVLFHGYGLSKDSLLPAAKIFHELGYETLLVDFRGSGGSAGTVTSLAHYEAMDVMRAFAAAGILAAGKPVILYGGSMGAAAALRAIHVHGIEPAALILECPYDRILNTVRNRFKLMRLPSFPLAHVLVFWGGVQQKFNAFGLQPERFAKSVRCPTFLIHGEYDSRVSIAEVNAVFAALPAEKQFKLLRNVGHEVYTSANPADWREAVGGFLTTLMEAKR